MPDFSPCDLHIPNKQWSRDPLEEQNYFAIERWARNFRENCVGGSCDCGEVLLVSFGTDSVTNNHTFSIDWTATVDPDGYGYDGGAAISWDDVTKEFVINQSGMYSVQGSAYITAFSITAGGSFQVAANRNDRFDGWFSCFDNDSNISNGPGDDIRLHPMSQPYPMPAGSRWYWNVTNHATGGSANVRLFFFVTKVNCCTIPPGPPIC